MVSDQESAREMGKGEAIARERKMEELRALRGKITIDYDWEKEEAREMSAQEE